MKTRKNILYIVVFSAILIGCANNAKDIESFNNPTAQSAKYPYLHAAGETLYMSWISSSDSTNTLEYARYADNSWSDPDVIARDSGWFVNWADFPSIIATESGPLAAHWLNKKPGGTYAYDVNIATMGSNTEWAPPLIPHEDGTATEHGFVSMIPWDGNTILAVWLDGRRSANRAPDEYYDLSKAMTLRGALISRDGEIEQSFLIDESVCDCCQTSLVKTDSGAMVAYRNRTDQEIRDIYLSRFDGATWSSPKVVHNDSWKIGACPVNGPKLAAADSTVLVTWHTGANDDPRAKAAISTNGGNSFEKPIQLNSKESLGRVDAAIYDGTGYVSWMAQDSTQKEVANLQLTSFGIQDNGIQTRTVAQLNSSRKTGFPQMELVGSDLFFAWTTVDSSGTSITTKRLATGN